MKKKEISEAVKKVAAITTGQADMAISVVFQSITHALERGDEVQIVGFGTFKVVEIAERQGHNPSTGETITIAAHKAVRFIPGKNLKAKVNG